MCESRQPKISSIPLRKKVHAVKQEKTGLNEALLKEYPQCEDSEGYRHYKNMFGMKMKEFKELTMEISVKRNTCFSESSKPENFVAYHTNFQELKELKKQSQSAKMILSVLKYRVNEFVSSRR
jgi:hypothetical protein